METLIKQARVRFSDVRQEEAAPQRTTSRSFKGEKSNWFQRQFSGTMSKDYETSTDGGDYSAAVAAAAYAISSLYDHHNHNTPQKTKLPDASSTKTEDASVKIPQPARRSRSLSESSAAKIQGEKEDMMTKMHEPARGSKTSSDDDSSGSDEKLTSVRKLFGKAPPIKRKISFADNLPNPTEVKEAERAITAKPSLKKRPTFTDDNPWLKRPTTFADNTLDRVETQRPETAGLKVGNDFPKPDPRDTIIKTATRAQGSKAATWERAEMGRIKQRYEKLRSTIDSWENKKKDKAKQKKEKREREVEQKRVRVLQQFRHEMENIDAVARGARAEAEKKKNKEELKVKKKANRIRTTGKLPPTCLCF